MRIIKLLVYLIKKFLPPIILVLVWVYNLRPITLLDKLLPIDLIKKTNSNPDIPPTIIGAIDVALLTVIFSLLSDLFSKFFSKPIELTIKLKPNNSSSDTANIKLPIEDIDKIEST
ncbi:hypothetical protein ACWGPK_25185, partial [Priestia megaterium]